MFSTDIDPGDDIAMAAIRKTLAIFLGVGSLVYCACVLAILLATQPWSSLFVSHYEGCELIEAEFPKSAALALALGFIPSIMGAAAFRSRRLRALVHNAGPIASSLVICGLCALALTAVIFARDGEAPAGMIATTSVPILLSNILCWALASRFAPITDDRIAVASEAT